MQSLLRDVELDFVTGLGARDGGDGGEAGLDTAQARLLLLHPLTPSPYTAQPRGWPYHSSPYCTPLLRPFTTLLYTAQARRIAPLLR